MSATHGTFTWYELMAVDPVGACGFYAQLLGWRYVPMAGTNGGYSLIDAGGLQIGGVLTLTPAMQAAGARPAWLGYVEVDGLEATLARLMSLGGTVVVGATRAGEAGHFALVSDPLGAMFYLFQSARGAVPDFSMAPGRVAWRELRSPDWERGFGFYAALFGWDKADRLEAAPGRPYQVFRTAGTPAGGTCDYPGIGHALWQYYFSVDSIDRAVERLLAGGGATLEGPHEITGGMWIVDARDPQGALLSLLGPRAP